MRSVSNRNNSSFTSTVSSNSGKNTKTSSGQSVSQLLAGKTSATSAGTLNAAKVSQMSTNYTAIKKAAAGLQTHAGKLLATGSDSIFGKAMPENSSSLTDAELSKNKDTVLKEISSFLGDYNAMISNMNTAGGTLNNLYLKQLKGIASIAQSALKEIGVTQKSDGTLSIDQRTMKSADMEDLKKVFGRKGGLTTMVSAKSETVESNASTTLISLNNSSNSGYNKNGSLIDILKSSGNKLDSKG